MSGSGTPFRCIALDAVGTLIYAEPSVSAAYAQHGQRFGSRLSPEEVKVRIAEAFRRADESAAVRFGEPGRTNEDHEYEFWRQVVQDVLPDVTDQAACFAELFEHFGRPESWRCFDDVDSTLKELQRRGYRVLIASNFDARLNRVCDGLSELRDVRCRVISSLVGYRKTHRGFYEAVVEAAECDRSEVLMIGDDLVNDVESARGSGIAAVHLRRESVPRPSGSGQQSPPRPLADGLVEVHPTGLVPVARGSLHHESLQNELRSAETRELPGQARWGCFSTRSDGRGTAFNRSAITSLTDLLELLP